MRTMQPTSALALRGHLLRISNTLRHVGNEFGNCAALGITIRLEMCATPKFNPTNHELINIFRSSL